jgi:hypothetical protein
MQRRAHDYAPIQVASPFQSPKPYRMDGYEVVEPISQSVKNLVVDEFSAL